MFYQHAQEVWDAKKCARLANRTATDGMGTKYHFKGFLHLSELGHYIHGLSVKYNGGCVRDNKWYQGEEWPLPKVADGFRIVYRPTWGYQIIKTEPAKGRITSTPARCRTTLA